MINLYVIKSVHGNYHYVGITNNLKNRLKRHNKGYNKSTKPHKPFGLILAEEFQNYKEARKREIFYKGGAGRKIIENLK